MDKRPEAYPWLTVHKDGSMEADMEGTVPAEVDRRLIIMQELQAGRLTLAAAPLLPGGEEAERLIRSLWDLWGEERIATQMGADTVERFKRILARPDAERAPQEDEEEWQYTEEPSSPDCPMCGKPFRPRPQGDEVETAVTRVRVELDGVFRSYGANLARLNPPDLDVVALRLARAALDARSGADTVKLADVVRAFLSETPVEHPAIGQIRYDAPAAVRYRETRAAVWDALVSGADRPEESQT